MEHLVWQEVVQAVQLNLNCFAFAVLESWIPSRFNKVAFFETLK